MHHRRTHTLEPEARRLSRLPLLIVLCVAQLMVILDISAVNVALPDMAGDLGIGSSDLGWTITSYSLIFGSLLLLGGRAADLLGRRRVFLAGLTVFTVASLASAVAADATMLFAARAGQGLGAALLSPAALSIITATFHGTERARALAVWGAVGGAGASSTSGSSGSRRRLPSALSPPASRSSSRLAWFRESEARCSHPEASRSSRPRFTVTTARGRSARGLPSGEPPRRWARWSAAT